MPPKWTAIEAAYHLGEAYAAEQGKDADYSPYAVELIPRAMDADPDCLETVWDAWQEEWLLAGLSEKAADKVRYWLDVVLIGGRIHELRTRAGGSDRSSINEMCFLFCLEAG